MKNINYDLIKLLHIKLDLIWRLEKFYIEDAKRENCQSASALEQILIDEKKHLELLKDSLQKRIEAGIFD